MGRDEKKGKGKIGIKRRGGKIGDKTEQYGERGGRHRDMKIEYKMEEGERRKRKECIGTFM